MKNFEKFAFRAGFTGSNLDNTQIGTTYAQALQNFMELIIADCVAICQNNEYFDDKALSPENCGAVRTGATFCKYGIKEHFGV